MVGLKIDYTNENCNHLMNGMAQLNVLIIIFHQFKEFNIKLDLEKHDIIQWFVFLLHLSLFGDFGCKDDRERDSYYLKQMKGLRSIKLSNYLIEMKLSDLIMSIFEFCQHMAQNSTQLILWREVSNNSDLAQQIISTNFGGPKWMSYEFSYFVTQLFIVDNDDEDNIV